MNSKAWRVSSGFTHYQWRHIHSLFRVNSKAWRVSSGFTHYQWRHVHSLFQVNSKAGRVSSGDTFIHYFKWIPKAEHVSSGLTNYHQWHVHALSRVNSQGLTRDRRTCKLPTATQSFAPWRTQKRLLKLPIAKRSFAFWRHFQRSHLHLRADRLAVTPRPFAIGSEFPKVNIWARDYKLTMMIIITIK